MVTVSGLSTTIKQHGGRPRVLVFLDYGRGRSSPAAYGPIGDPGSNPYGYRYAEPLIDVALPVNRGESSLFRAIRKTAKRVTGCDIVHAIRHRADLNSAQMIWTHTEKEWLAVLLLQKLGVISTRPVLAQSIWLWDRWPSLGPLRRRAIQFLAGGQQVFHTTLSPANAEFASKVLGRAAFFVPFGLEIEVPSTTPAAVGRSGRRVVTALGNDRDRDWEILRRAAAARPTLDFRVYSRRRAAAGRSGLFNYRSNRARGADSIERAYQRADVVVVPLSHNRHASGVTVILEALQRGIPVAASATGGIETYFDGLIKLVPVGDVGAMVEAIDELMTVGRQDLTGEIIGRGLTASDYAIRNARLSLDFLEHGKVLDTTACAVGQTIPQRNWYQRYLERDQINPHQTDRT